MPTKTSPYLLIFRDASHDVYSTISAQERQELMQQWNAWYDGLAAQGKVQHGHPLEPQGRVVSGPRGERVVDGPFAEAKEAIGGYFLLTVADLDEATAIAQRCPSRDVRLLQRARLLPLLAVVIGLDLQLAVRQRPGPAAQHIGAPDMGVGAQQVFVDGHLVIEGVALQGQPVLARQPVGAHAAAQALGVVVGLFAGQGLALARIPGKPVGPGGTLPQHLRPRRRAGRLGFPRGQHRQP